MTATAASAVEKRKKPWTKARVIDLLIDILCFVVVGAASLTCILPFIHILAKSLSDNAYVVANKVLLLPKSDVGVNLEATICSKRQALIRTNARISRRSSCTDLNSRVICLLLLLPI